MVTREDIESWLSRLDGGTVDYKEVEPGLWLVHTSAGAEVVVHCAALWVFVDFESGLNTAANRLRLTLGDSAENPR